MDDIRPDFFYLFIFLGSVKRCFGWHQRVSYCNETSLRTRVLLFHCEKFQVKLFGAWLTFSSLKTTLQLCPNFAIETIFPGSSNCVRNFKSKVESWWDVCSILEAASNIDSKLGEKNASCPSTFLGFWMVQKCGKHSVWDFYNQLQLMQQGPGKKPQQQINK